ncbi:hypothetical protein BDR05DRAFT_1001555 [Suillus weaverae]|nr:hypothetical protein BDR05DRAFT_1001555 [Suillus weaverae]
MTDQQCTLQTVAAMDFLIWDVANIFEYATSRFTVIHIALLQHGTNRQSDSYRYSFSQHLVWEAECFVIPFALKPLVPAPAALDPETMLACGQLASVLAEAYKHPIKLDMDMIQYNEALAKRESGLNDAWEEELLVKFPPTERMFLDCPSVVIDSGYQIILWYLPATLNWSLQEEPERHVHRHQWYGKYAAA